jgi:hypothetical protein
MTQKEALRALHATASECVEYVGSANYPHRERAALRALTRAFRAYATEDYANIRQDIGDIDANLQLISD